MKISNKRIKCNIIVIKCNIIHTDGPILNHANINNAKCKFIAKSDCVVTDRNPSFCIAQIQRKRKNFHLKGKIKI